ncbi:MAG TPA: hypothetical protein VJP77_06295 [Planctomycetota bacterium]|nr:hypothetical protein [Planctomycetota bacterium]
MQIQVRRFRGGPGRRGSALLFAAIAAVAIAGLCAAILSLTTRTSESRVRGFGEQRALYAAEAGLSDAYVQVTAELLPLDTGAPVLLGAPDQLVELGPVGYWVEVTQPNPRDVVLLASGVDGLDEVRLELVLSRLPNGFFQFAAFGADGVNLDSNAFIDSYDSNEGSYLEQVQAGAEYAKQNGDVGSNGDITLKANTQVHGDAKPGPTGSLNDNAPGTFVAGSTEPLEEEVVLPPIDVPVAASSSGALVGSSAVVVGPADVLHYDSILMQGGSTLEIVGPCKLVVDDLLLKSNSEIVFNTDGGEIEVFGTGNFVLESNSVLTTQTDSALDVTLLLSGDNSGPGAAHDVELGANASFTGAIYAPYCEFSLASNFTIYGSIMCGFLDLSSFGEIHFDEALLYDGYGASGELEPRYWRRAPLQ